MRALLCSEWITLRDSYVPRSHNHYQRAHSLRATKAHDHVKLISLHLASHPALL